MAEGTGAVIVADRGAGEPGDFTPLTPLCGAAVVDRVLDSLEQAGVSPVVLVTGRRGDELQAHLNRRRVQLVHNPRPGGDMLRAALPGLDRIAGQAARTLLLPVEVPLFDPATPVRLLAKMRRRGRQVLRPTHLGMPGYPLLMDTALIPRLQSCREEGGAMGAIREAGYRPIPLRDRGAVMAADTPDGFKLLELLCDPGVPPHIRRHMAATAVLAVGFAKALNRRGRSIDLPDLELAALLHDVARLEPRHWDRGADLLLAAGRPELAHMVRNHMDPAPEEQGRISPTTLLFLADKYIQEDHLVTLDVRYHRALCLPPGPQLDHARGNFELAKALTALLEQELEETLTETRLEEMANADLVYRD